MSGSFAKVQLLGNLARDPERRETSHGGLVRLRLMTNESWKDRETGERKSRSQGHDVVVYHENIGNTLMNYTRKGSKIYIEGALETRKYVGEDDVERYITEVIVRPYRGHLELLDRPDGGSDSGDDRGGNRDDNRGDRGGDRGGNRNSDRDDNRGGRGNDNRGSSRSAFDDALDDEVPF